MQPPTAARTVHYHPDGLARDLHLFRVIAEDAHTLQEPRLHYNHSHTFDHYHFHEEDEITTAFTVLSYTSTHRIFGPRPWDPRSFFGPCPSTSSHVYHNRHHHYHHPPFDEPVDHEIPTHAGPKRRERAARAPPVGGPYFHNIWFDPMVEPEQEPPSKQDPDLAPHPPSNTLHVGFVFNTKFTHRHFHCRNGYVVTETDTHITTGTFETFAPCPLSEDVHPRDDDPPQVLGDCSYIVDHTHEHGREPAEEPPPPTPPPPTLAGTPEWF